MNKKLTIIIVIIILFTINCNIVASELEIFSWWTAEGEAEGLQALFHTYRENNPEVVITNATIAGGAGSKAKTVLKTRMLAGKPPDSFQVHGGSELIDTWVKSDYLQPITELWKQEEWLEVFPRKLIDLISHDNNIYSVPLNIHRSNILWYNREIFNKYNLQPPRSFAEFFETAKYLQKRDIIPLALGSKNVWPVTHIFENILLGVTGPRFYKQLINGNKAWTDERVIKTLQILKRMLKYTNQNHATLTWDKSCSLIQDKKAAMTIMGSWAKGYFTTNNWISGQDFGAVPTPGTENNFVLVTDTFGLPKNAPHPENAIKWLKLIGSRPGQLAANPKLGSIPARTDIEKSNFDIISKKQIKDFKTSKLVLSITHGSAVIEPFIEILNEELAIFIYEKNVEKTASRLENKVKELGL